MTIAKTHQYTQKAETNCSLSVFSSLFDQSEVIPLSSRDNSYHLFLSLVNYFSLTSSDRLNFDIIVQLIQKSKDQQYLPMEELAMLSHVSQSTISRFVRSMGFKSYQEFSMNFHQCVQIAEINRNSIYHDLDAHTSDVPAYMLTNIIDNLQHTKDSLNIPLLKTIIEQIKMAPYTVVIGTPETIAHFSRFSRDLIANGYPCFLFYDVLSQRKMNTYIRSGGCLLFPVLSNDYISLFSKQIRETHDGGMRTILLTQDPMTDTSLPFDIIYTYGKANDYRLGDYSLEYIASILSYLLIEG